MAVRKGQSPGKLDQTTFLRRFMGHFFDPAFRGRDSVLHELADIAWQGHAAGRKAPVTRKAGPDFADPDYDMSVEWLEARKAVLQAQKRHEDQAAPARILVICASPRTDDTCPGENSKSYRLAVLARDFLMSQAEVDFLDLSRLTAEYGRVIFPCKACVSTAMPLCHWPCSCYPNHSLGQVNDWMNEIYPKWVAAHGILIVSPVHWYQAPSVLKLMIDRLVCADGGNPDPTTTHGKDPEKAKALELAGWSYPRHLAGRAFGLIVHGDTDGTRSLSDALSDWLSSMGLVAAGKASVVDRYIGYYEPYATSHEALDRDAAIQKEALNAAQALIEKVRLIRSGQQEAGENLADPRPK